MVATNLGSLVQLCCVEGGTPQTIAAGVCGELPVDGQHWVSHSPRWHVLPRSTLLRLQGALQGHCPKWALGFMHFPGLSRSGSQVLRTGTDLAGHVFYALPRPQQLRRPGAWRGHCPRWAVHLFTSLVPAAQFPRCAARALS